MGSLGEGPTDCATDCLSYNLRGTLVLPTVTVNRVNGYNLDMVSAVDMRRRTQPEAGLRPSRYEVSDKVGM